MSNVHFWHDHHRLAVSEQPQESLRIIGGTSPVLTRPGWIVIGYGVDGTITRGTDRQINMRDFTSVLILSRDHVAVWCTAP